MAYNSWTYSRKIEDKISHICQNSLNLLGIEYFSFMYSSKDGRVFYFSNQSDWHQFSLENGILTELSHHNLVGLYSSGVISFWNQHPNNTSFYFKSLKEDFKISDGITINLSNHNMFKCYSFAFHTGGNRNSFLSQNIQNLYRFLHYFENEMMVYLNECIENYSDPGTNPISSNSFGLEAADILNTFLKNTQISCGNFFCNGTIIRLTKRETLCLSLLSRGYSMKGIAQELGISSRTVEIFLRRVKEKTRLYSKERLSQLYYINNKDIIL